MILMHGLQIYSFRNLQLYNSSLRKELNIKKLHKRMLGVRLQEAEECRSFWKLCKNGIRLNESFWIAIRLEAIHR